MKVIVNEFISLDGVVQAPGGPEEDTDGGFAHGGWSHPYFDVEMMGAEILRGICRGRTRCCSGGARGAAWQTPGPGGRATPSPTR